jgi:hypothetical protein
MLDMPGAPDLSDLSQRLPLPIDARAAAGGREILSPRQPFLFFFLPDERRDSVEIGAQIPGEQRGLPGGCAFFQKSSPQVSVRRPEFRS